MNKRQCKVYLQRVASQSVSKSNVALLTGDIPSSLSIDAETVAETVSIPLSVLSSIWKKAEELVSSSQECISSAPGHPTECKMVVVNGHIW